eukprot:1195534-Prorocentrum_minimum.AAC.6
MSPFVPFMSPFVPFMSPFVPFMSPFVPFMSPFVPFMSLVPGDAACDAKSSLSKPPRWRRSDPEAAIGSRAGRRARCGGAIGRRRRSDPPPAPAKRRPKMTN